jgi:hypothetical protein
MSTPAGNFRATARSSGGRKTSGRRRFAHLHAFEIREGFRRLLAELCLAPHAFGGRRLEAICPMISSTNSSGDRELPTR